MITGFVGHRQLCEHGFCAIAVEYRNPFISAIGLLARADDTSDMYLLWCVPP